MPYGIKGNFKIGWCVFNREYKRLGIDNYHDKSEPTWIKYKDLNDDLIKELIEMGCHYQKTNEDINDKDEEIIQLFFYNDSNNPVNSRDELMTIENWINYNNIIMRLSRLKLTSQDFG